MQPVNLLQIISWKRIEDVEYPERFSTTCPHCFEKAIFILGEHLYDPHRNVATSSGRCPGCNERIHLWVIRPSRKLRMEVREVYLYPPIKFHRSLMNLEEVLPENLLRSYLSTVDAFNTKNYIATAVCCRRTLEDLFHSLTPDEHKSEHLSEIIAKVRASTDFTQPLDHLAHVTRPGSCLDAYFDIKTTPDAGIAKVMLDLLECVIVYLYLLPKEMEQLDRQLDGTAPLRIRQAPL